MSEQGCCCALRKMIPQLVRYFFVAGAAFAADFGVFALVLYGLGGHYSVAAVGGFVAGLTVNYLLCKRFVFTQRVQSTTLEVVSYAVIGLLGLGLQELLLYLMIDCMQCHAILAKLIATGIVFFWNFFARKILLYSMGRKQSR